MKIKLRFGWYGVITFMLFCLPIIAYRMFMTFSEYDIYRKDLWNVGVGTCLFWWAMFNFRLERKKK